MKKLLLLLLLLSFQSTTYANSVAPKPVMPLASPDAVNYTIGTIDYIFWSGNKRQTTILENQLESDALTYQLGLTSLWRQGNIKQITHINGIPIEKTRWANFAGIIPKQGVADGIPTKARNLPLKIFFNGYYMDTSDLPPYIDSTTGKTMVPLRLLSDLFIAKSIWNQKTNSVTISSKGKVALLSPGSKSAKVNNIEQTLETPVTIRNNQVYVPFTFVAQMFGAKVEWRNGVIQVTAALQKNKRHYSDVVATHPDNVVMCDQVYITFLIKDMGLKAPNEAANYAKSRMGIHATCK